MKNILTLLALGAAACSAPAMAEGQSADLVSTTVPFGDLDLSTASGRATLDKRIDKAARDVCEHGQNPTIELERLAGECAERAQASARRSVEIALGDSMPVSGRAASQNRSPLG